MQSCEVGMDRGIVSDNRHGHQLRKKNDHVESLSLSIVFAQHRDLQGMSRQELVSINSRSTSDRLDLRNILYSF